LSTICPLPGIALEHLDSFQLDLTSFEGNSGGRFSAPKPAKFLVS
jgi:hypothetical protein